MKAEASCSSCCLFVGMKRSRVEDDAWKGKRSEAEGEPHPCTECGKKFWSWKALFGHMRCHPERQWRGINPPPNVMRAQQQARDEQVSMTMTMTMTEEDHEVAACLLLLANGQFECSSCNKVFGSHQALGGHRASHKNVKGCFANANPNPNSDDNNINIGHKCSICQRVFSTGQALGGHKRCHWDKSSHSLDLDLNLPPPSSSSSSPPLSLDLTLGL